MIADGHLRAAYLIAAAELRGGALYALPVPSSLDVLAIVRRLGIVASQRDLLARAAVLNLPLSDSDPELPL